MLPASIPPFLLSATEGGGRCVQHTQCRMNKCPQQMLLDNNQRMRVKAIWLLAPLTALSWASAGDGVTATHRLLVSIATGVTHPYHPREFVSHTAVLLCSWYSHDSCQGCQGVQEIKGGGAEGNQYNYGHLIRSLPNSVPINCIKPLRQKQTFPDKMWSD